jgi:hypothetical protein
MKNEILNYEELNFVLNSVYTLICYISFNYPIHFKFATEKKKFSYSIEAQQI